jgi:hypothetical protein
MSKRELIREELQHLYKDGASLAIAFQKNGDQFDFHYEYQGWYSKALKAVAYLAPDRHIEFKSYYEIDPKRKALRSGTFVIQDFMKGVFPNPRIVPEFNSRNEVSICFKNQLTILKSIEDRIDSLISNIEDELYSELQENELVVARQLSKISIRAAGALVGVVIEGHLQKVAETHGIKIAKKNPTIADLNDPLKAAGILDTAAWRKISFLADIRNLCSHKKDAEPTKEQAEELIQGAEWLTKNVF